MPTISVPIYGVKSATASIDNFNASIYDSLESFYRAVTIITINVWTLFPPTFLLNEIVGEMSVRARLPDVLFVRVVWRERHPSVYFQTKNIYHRLQIKDIYLEFHIDHRNDPLFKDQIGKIIA